MFIIEYNKNPKKIIQELNPSFLFDLHQCMVINEHRYASSVSMGGL
jgi:hypothetical protein